MKHILCLFAFSVLLTSASVVLVAQEKQADAKHDMKEQSFGIKEFDAFHHVLHPLQHEAIPKKDYQAIRAKAAELKTLGDAIVKLGTPDSISKAKKYAQELKEFGEKLAKLQALSEKGTDKEIKKMFAEVHEEFEELAHMLPKK